VLRLSLVQERAFQGLDPRSARVRVLLGTVVAIAVFFALPSDFAHTVRFMIAWDAGSLVLLGIVAAIVFRANATETRRRAAAFDPGRAFTWIVVLAASAVSLLAAFVVLRDKKHLTEAEQQYLLGLCIVTVALSWLVTHTGFALRYAHLYYRGGREDEGGLEFPSDEDPDDLDFVYYAYTIGMCFQVSDVSAASRDMRRVTLLHSMISFVYNTAVVAFAINVVAGALGS
jgi:uncharacterized membrane protein